MAIETLEQRINLYGRAVIEAVCERISSIGSILNIGEHVLDNKCQIDSESYKKNPASIPADAIFAIRKGNATHYAWLGDNSSGLEEGWFTEGGKIALAYCSSGQPQQYLQKEKEGKIVNATVTVIEHGGSAGNSAIAERAFLDFLIYAVKRSSHPDSGLVADDLQRVKVLYAGIDSEKEPSAPYYAEQGLIIEGKKTSLMVTPEGYSVPDNFIFETGVKTVLQSPLTDFNPNDGQFPEHLSMANFSNIGMVALICPKHSYLLHEGYKLFLDPKVARAGAFSTSSLAKNKDTIINRVLPVCDIILENREELQELTGQSIYGAIDDIAASHQGKELTVYTSMDRTGIMGSTCWGNRPVKEWYATPYHPNLSKQGTEPEFTGAGDTAMGIALVGTLLGLPLHYILELANLFATYRISHEGIHSYAVNLPKEINQNRKLCLPEYYIDQGRPNPLRR